MFCESAKVLDNHLLAPRYFKLILEAPLIAPHIQAGQFIQIRCARRCDPLLPRPMSIYRVDGERLEILYEVIGKGTTLMAQTEKGERLAIYGPLGRPFWEVAGAKRIFLIGGGIGLAPFYALAEAFLTDHRPETIDQRPKVKSQKPEITVLFGARTKERVVCEEEFRKLGVGFEVSTDDGSYGFHGRVTQLLEKRLAELPSNGSTALYACGPNVMMQETCRVALAHNLPCQVSLDEPMACGFGICFGCAVKISAQCTVHSAQKDSTEHSALSTEHFTYKLACTDGPVFEAREVLWE